MLCKSQIIMSISNPSPILSCTKLNVFPCLQCHWSCEKTLEIYLNLWFYSWHYLYKSKQKYLCLDPLFIHWCCANFKHSWTYTAYRSCIENKESTRESFLVFSTSCSSDIDSQSGQTTCQTGWVRITSAGETRFFNMCRIRMLEIKLLESS